MMKAIFGFEYDDLWKAIIRPPREQYKESDLGPKEFTVGGKACVRSDLEIINNRKLKLQCSFWEPIKRPCQRLPCVVYLHGNSSCRIEAVREIKDLLQNNICLFAFDFSGCGQSEGEYISLGWWEIQDVKCVIERLKNSVIIYYL